MSADPGPRLTVAELRRERGGAEHRGHRVALLAGVYELALRTIAEQTCPHGAGDDETCDRVAQPFVVPDVCPVCEARCVLRDCGVAR